ncbi:FAD/NAD(P)-binding protein [Candidatus Desantisbacteria bacterium]|nr:FAD/NAD(P)-binding protein [Candidatus Desantisbacteria bacterium]
MQPAESVNYIPEQAEILDTKNFTENEKFFRIRLKSEKCLGHIPGQFVELSIPGIGEAPISLCSSPTEKDFFEVCIRKTGNVTNAIHKLKTGDTIGIRGPFGNGFPVERLTQKNIIIVGGGLGVVPLRSLINYISDNRLDYKNIYLLFGTKTPGSLLFYDEFVKKADKHTTYMNIVDYPDKGWTGRVGVITTLIPEVDINFREAYSVIVGPPIMYKFVIRELVSYGMPKEHIFLSLERRMKCGLGKCGHCQMHNLFTCQDGPVFDYAQLENIKGAI